MKSRKSRDTWSSRQVWAWSGIQNEAGKRLIEFSQENTPVIANTLFQQHKGWLYTWRPPDGQYQNQIDYILCSQRWKTSIQSAKTRPEADCGSDHELPVEKFRFKLKKVGKTTRPFRYDLNQIPYNYTAEVTNWFKGLHLTECLKNYEQRFVTLYRRQRSRPFPRKRNAKKAKWLPEKALQIAVKRREPKGKEEKERYTHLNAEFRRIAKRGKKAFLSEQCKEIRKRRNLFKKIQDTKVTFHAKMGTIKARNGMDLIEA